MEVVTPPTNICICNRLSKNYVVNAEESVPKDSIYRRYCLYCKENQVSPKKSNIFGKMLKKMFPNIRPRRLGSAGNMVAHYAGITLRPHNYQQQQQQGGVSLTTSAPPKGF